MSTDETRPPEPVHRDVFVRLLKKQVEAFSKYWDDMQVHDPNYSPMVMELDDWEEQFSAFCEDHPIEEV